MECRTTGRLLGVQEEMQLGIKWMGHCEVTEAQARSCDTWIQKCREQDSSGPQFHSRKPDVLAVPNDKCCSLSFLDQVQWSVPLGSLSGCTPTCSQPLPTTSLFQAKFSRQSQHSPAAWPWARCPLGPSGASSGHEGHSSLCTLGLGKGLDVAVRGSRGR